MWSIKFCLYGFLVLSAATAVLALNTSGFVYKSGTAGIGALIILLLQFQRLKPPKAVWLVFAAFLFSIGGDWFLSIMKGDNGLFIKGIALYFIAHLGYLWYAALNGKLNRKFTVILLSSFLLYFYFLLWPRFEETMLLLAVLIYLLISCLSLGMAVGMNGSAIAKWAFVFGVFLILISDTIISFKEFLGNNNYNYMILPTYYLAHLSISFSLIRAYGNSEKNHRN